MTQPQKPNPLKNFLESSQKPDLSTPEAAREAASSGFDTKIPIANKATATPNAILTKNPGDDIFTYMILGIVTAAIIVGIVSLSDGGGGGGSSCPIKPVCYGAMPPTCKCPASCPKRRIITNPPAGQSYIKGYVQCE